MLISRNEMVYDLNKLQHSLSLSVHKVGVGEVKLSSTRELAVCFYELEPPIKDPPRKGQPPYKGRSSGPLSHSSSTFLTSEKRTTSQQRTKWLIPWCPLFGGSTVLIFYGHCCHQTAELLIIVKVNQLCPLYKVLIFLLH